FKKRRSTWFFLANKHFKRIRDLGVLTPGDLAPLETYYDCWREAYAQKYVHLARAQEHLFIKQYSRFDGDYRLLLKQKLRLLNFMVWNLKIELTIDPKKTMRYSDGFYLLKKGWNRLRSWLRRRYGDFDYFQVMEIQKSGRPHLHVLLSGIHWIDHSELSGVWSSYGCGEIVYLKQVDSGNQIKMSSYVLKYVNKTLKAEDKAFSAVLFASNKRLFSMSQGCQDLVNVGRAPTQKQGYEFQGSVYQRHLAEFCDEKAVQIEPFMRIEVQTEDIYRFPELFGVDSEGYTWIEEGEQFGG
ncbi:MAG: hypothetical protein QUS12_15705, partial [Methanosarcina sp.]|nr:hypothetical protein [Methanosarcina sp.]